MQLSPFAIPYAVTAGRVYSEVEDPARTPFQRDRDRVIYSKAFRRLSGKTQVFTAKHTDHIRDRLTHSLEVAQVARDMARMLGLNEDVCEAVALAHDLGHTPFGHAGEQALDEMMQQYGGHFEHNEQSKRIVEVLEHPYPHFVGLNLTAEVLDGLAKHQTLYDQKTKEVKGKTLEAQVVDKADEIAYHSHDLDDGLRQNLFTYNEVRELTLIKSAIAHVEETYKIPAQGLTSRIVSSCMRLMIADLTGNARRQINERGIESLGTVVMQTTDCVFFSSSFAPQVEELRSFLWEKMYNAPNVVEMSKKGQEMLKKLFAHYVAHPELLPENYKKSIGVSDTLYVVVKDYVAGMTDWFAQLETTKLG